jgi:AcrR family transcriptional regulator
MEVLAPKSPRTRVLHSATRLFGARGFRAVGVDDVVEDAGVAKMTLYKHFESKDTLLEACIREAGAQWRAWLRDGVDRLSPGAAGKPAAVFSLLEEWFTDPEFRGCIAINMIAEISDPNHPALRAALEHKRLVREYLRTLCADAGVRDAALAGDHLVLLMEGAIITSQLWKSPEPARRARRVVESMI